MVTSAARPAVTPQEYLAAERVASEKHEYWKGEVFAMAGASFRHNLLVSNFVRVVGNALRGGPCVAFPSDMKIHIPAKPGFVYPDASVLCGPPEVDASGTDVLLNPTLVVEVLSKSTEAFDRGEKFDGYRTVASVRDVVLVSQRERKVEVFSRQPDGAWLLRVACDADRASLPSLGIALPLVELYERAFDLAGDED
jgi:Uma2 family endonuclease